MDRKKKILLVEDDAIISLYKKSVFEQAGYAVITARSGEHAVELAESSGPDILLMDINLGKGISGVQAAKSILKKKNFPLIFITSHSAKEVKCMASSIGNFRYLSKSSPVHVMLSEVKKAVQSASNTCIA